MFEEWFCPKCGTLNKHRPTCCQCNPIDQQTRRVSAKTAPALKAAPQAEKAREIIERAEEELRSWSDHFHCRNAMLSTESTDQLLADIAAYKEG